MSKGLGITETKSKHRGSGSALNCFVMREIPSQDVENISIKMKADNFYKLPREIECFIDRANGELPKPYRVLPWTINRAVTLFREAEPIWHITYEEIEGNIVKMLDHVNKKARA